MSRRVAVTMRLLSGPGTSEVRDAVSHDWIVTLAALGVVPVLVPNRLEDPAAFASGEGVSALLLTGGEDLGDTPRDRTERALLAHACSRRLPTLGVCRGFQLVNAVFGGRVEPLGREAGHVARDHQIEPTGRLARLWGPAPVAVNSFHLQGVRRAGIAPVCALLASAAHGVAEGISHLTLPVWGVQWHPERPSPTPEHQRQLLEHWLDGFPEER